MQTPAMLESLLSRFDGGHVPHIASSDENKKGGQKIDQTIIYSTIIDTETNVCASISFGQPLWGPLRRRAASLDAIVHARRERNCHRTGAVRERLAQAQLHRDVCLCIHRPLFVPAHPYNTHNGTRCYVLCLELTGCGESGSNWKGGCGARLLGTPRDSVDVGECREGEAFTGVVPGGVSEMSKLNPNSTPFKFNIGATEFVPSFGGKCLLKRITTL